MSNARIINMAVDASTNQPDRVNASNQDSVQILEYEKILKLREDIFADLHPRLKVPKALQTKSVNHSIDLPLTQVQNGVHKQSEAAFATPTKPQFSLSAASQSISSIHRSSNGQYVATAASGLSRIDPVLLTRSEVLVKAELKQKRQRIERALEEQINQQKVASRNKTSDQDALPDFDVTEVLRKAQEIVKPFKPIESNGANRTASSSDSFDENTFYSSQMNDSTTEEADDVAKSRPNGVCRSFLDGCCRLGDDCALSHESATKEKVEGDGPQNSKISNVAADEQGKLRRSFSANPVQEPESGDPPPISQQDRIAELEEQLRKLKSQRGDAVPKHVSSHPPEPRDVADETAYSPPEAGDLMINQHGAREEFREQGGYSRKEPIERRDSTIAGNRSREYERRNEKSNSPASNSIRVVRNHITSPVAPQPARVSPLAVARMPNIHQGQQILSENDRPSQGPGAFLSARHSPQVLPQSSGPKKRRREMDSHDQVRNVIARRASGSPQVRVKEEPVSPPPNLTSLEDSRARRRQDPSWPGRMDNDSPRYQDRGSVIYQPQIVERVPQAVPKAYVTDDLRPITPVARRIVSRNGHFPDFHEEPDLRRVVSTRHIRVPRSPPEQYPAAQPLSARPTSQVFLSQPVQVLSRPPGGLDQSIPLSHVDPDRSTSPLPLRRASPPMHGPVSMAPPRRIVVDQYGQRYFPTPVIPDRQTSVIPLNRQAEYVPRYEQLPPRSSIIRDSQDFNVYEERPYISRARSPPSPHYVEYRPNPPPRHLVARGSGQVYSEEVHVPRNDSVRISDHFEPQSMSRHEDINRPREGIIRTQSVRPVGDLYEDPRERITRIQSVRPVSDQYEDPRERVTRIQSVRPQQERIISLDRRQEIAPQGSRQVSVRADETFSRPTAYSSVERPKYRYTTEAQERRYMETAVDENVVYEVPPTSGRRGGP